MVRKVKDAAARVRAKNDRIIREQTAEVGRFLQPSVQVEELTRDIIVETCPVKEARCNPNRDPHHELCRARSEIKTAELILEEDNTRLDLLYNEGKIVTMRMPLAASLELQAKAEQQTKHKVSRYNAATFEGASNGVWRSGQKMTRRRLAANLSDAALSCSNPTSRHVESVSDPDSSGGSVSNGGGGGNKRKNSKKAKKRRDEDGGLSTDAAVSNADDHIVYTPSHLTMIRQMNLDSERLPPLTDTRYLDDIVAAEIDKIAQPEMCAERVRFDAELADLVEPYLTLLEADDEIVSRRRDQLPMRAGDRDIRILATLTRAIMKKGFHQQYEMKPAEPVIAVEDFVALCNRMPDVGILTMDQVVAVLKEAPLFRLFEDKTSSVQSICETDSTVCITDNLEIEEVPKDCIRIWAKFARGPVYLATFVKLCEMDNKFDFEVDGLGLLDWPLRIRDKDDEQLKTYARPQFFRCTLIGMDSSEFGYVHSDDLNENILFHESQVHPGVLENHRRTGRNIVWRKDDTHPEALIGLEVSVLAIRLRSLDLGECGTRYFWVAASVYRDVTRLATIDPPDVDKIVKFWTARTAKRRRATAADFAPDENGSIIGLQSANSRILEALPFSKFDARSKAAQRQISQEMLDAITVDPENGAQVGRWKVYDVNPSDASKMFNVQKEDDPDYIPEIDKSVKLESLRGIVVRYDPYAKEGIILISLSKRRFAFFNEKQLNSKLAVIRPQLMPGDTVMCSLRLRISTAGGRRTIADRDVAYCFKLEEVMYWETVPVNVVLARVLLTPNLFTSPSIFPDVHKFIKDFIVATEAAKCEHSLDLLTKHLNKAWIDLHDRVYDADEIRRSLCSKLDLMYAVQNVTLKGNVSRVLALLDVYRQVLSETP